MRILVTGSEGIIGVPLCRALLAAGHDIIPFDLNSPQGRFDIRDAYQLKSRMRGCDGVIHLAAISRVRGAQKQPFFTYLTNVMGTQTLLDVAQSFKPAPWVLFASSREVYGQIPTLPARESSPLKPINVVGRTKMEGERRCRAAQAAGLSVGILRLGNIYGSPVDYQDRVVPAFIHAALNGEPLAVNASNPILDFVHIDDAIRSFMLALERLAAKSSLETTQIVSGVPTDLNALAKACIQLCQSPSRLGVRAYQDFEITRFYGDPSQAEALLGWRSEIPLNQGLEALIDRHRAHILEAPALLSDCVG